MKKVAVLFLTLAIQALSFAQVITIDVFEIQPHVKWEKTDSKNVLGSPEWTGYKEQVRGTHIIDLDNMTMVLIYDGKTSAPVKIKKIETVGTRTTVSFDDPLIGDSNTLLESTFTFDSTLNTSNHTWYDHDKNYTRTHLNTKCKITVSSKKYIF